MNEDKQLDDIIAIIQQVESDVSNEPQPMMFGISLKDLFDGNMKSTFDKMLNREAELMRKIAKEYYQVRLMDHQGTQSHTFDFNTALSKFTAFEFIVRQGDRLTPTSQYAFEKNLNDLANALGYKVRLERK